MASAMATPLNGFLSVLAQAPESPEGHREVVEASGPIVAMFEGRLSSDIAPFREALQSDDRAECKRLCEKLRMFLPSDHPDRR